MFRGDARAPRPHLKYVLLVVIRPVASRGRQRALVVDAAREIVRGRVARGAFLAFSRRRAAVGTLSRFLKRKRYYL